MNQTSPDTDAQACGICRRELGSDGLPPSRDGDAWICGDCDEARSFGSLDDYGP